MPPARLFLIDGSSLVYRSYFALLRGGRSSDGRPAGLSTRSGLPTGAVYGFLTTLRKILAEHRPDHLAIALDEAAPTFRHQAYADYKANRKPMPDDLRLQMPFVRRAVEALRIPLLSHERFEADDILGTLARRGAEAGHEVVLVTMDKDMYQLLGPRVSMLQTRLETRLVRAEDVEGEFGVRPAQVVDVLALWGDPSDNIPGVAGIGEKGAKALVARWGDLDGVYAHLDELKPAQAEKLRAQEAAARLSRDLATIRTDLDIPLELAALARVEPDRERLLALCRELEFRALADELAPAAAATGPGDYAVLDRLADLDPVLAEAEALGRLGLHLELGGTDAMRAGIVGLALAVSPGRAVYLPFGHDYPGSPPQLALEAALARARPVLASARVAKTGADLKQWAVALAERGIPLQGLDRDTSLLSYLLEPGRPSHGLDALAREVLGREPRPVPAPVVKGRGAAPPEKLPVAELGLRAAEQADLALQVADRLAAELEPAGLAPLYRDVELKLLEVLAAMERAGVKVDLDYLGSMSAEIERRLGELTARIHELAGVEFNILSPRQLGEVLFERMKLPVLKKTRKSRSASTDLEVLEELAAGYELPRLVLEHRELAKLQGTYVDALPALVHPRTGRVHTCYHQTVAATGRLSSSDPNLQNIPIRTELGRRIRRAFVAEPGRVLLVADYSQIELRLMAHLSGDPELGRAFRDGADVHRRTAATVFGIPEELVTSELRRRAKVINFGIIYGMSGYGLGRELGMSPGEASRLIGQYFARYAGVRAWLDRTIAEARERGQVTTLLGRHRRLPEIASSKRPTREYGERMAVNTPIQGTAADLIKVAMVAIHRRLGAAGLSGRLLLQVHDELVLEVPAAEVEPTTRLVREEMEGAARLSVPLEVAIGHGPSWLEAK